MKTLNILKNYIYIYENGKIVKKELMKQKGITTSFLYPKSILSLTKKFNKTFSKDELIIEMEKYIFSYPNIDINKEYKIVYLFVERENNIVVEALLIDSEKLQNEYKEILNIYKYIDFISPAFLAWKEYYNIQKIPKKNDVFIYFSTDDSFLSVFSEGKYLFHKSISKLSVLEKITGKKNNELIQILQEKGLDKNKYEDKNLFAQVDKFFSEYFLKVFNLLNYSLNDYEIAKYERIFFYSPIKIGNIFEQYTDYWKLHGVEFKSLSLQTEYNFFEYLITVFNAKNYENDGLNFSIFKKPPLFITTSVGKLLSFIFMCVLFVVIFIGINLYNINKLEDNVNILNKKYSMLQTKNKENLTVIKQYKNAVKLVNDKLDDIDGQIADLSDKINLLNIKSKESAVYNILTKITYHLKQYNLKIKNITKEKNHFSLIILSNYDNTHEITVLMQDLISDGFKNVNSKTIKNKSDKYISYVEFDNE